MKLFILLPAIMLLVPHYSNAQQRDAWGKFGFVIGEWIGGGSGAPGGGSGSFSFLPDLGGKILVRKNHSEYPADKNKPPVVHDDLLIVYRDAPDPDEKAIYFDNEGHVIRYAVSNPADGKIIFSSGKAAGIPYFRLTYEMLEEGSIGILFERSRDGINYQKYLEGKARRKN